MYICNLFKTNQFMHSLFVNVFNYKNTFISLITTRYWILSILEFQKKQKSLDLMIKFANFAKKKSSEQFVMSLPYVLLDDMLII